MGSVAKRPQKPFSVLFSMKEYCTSMAYCNVLLMKRNHEHTTGKTDPKESVRIHLLRCTAFKTVLYLNDNICMAKARIHTHESIGQTDPSSTSQGHQLLFLYSVQRPLEHSRLSSHRLICLDCAGKP